MYIFYVELNVDKSHHYVLSQRTATMALCELKISRKVNVAKTAVHNEIMKHRATGDFSD